MHPRIAAVAAALSCLMGASACTGSSAPRAVGPGRSSATSIGSGTAPSAAPSAARTSTGAASTASEPTSEQTTAIVSTPVRSVVTARGTVGYRSVGSGRPLLLITGFSASLDSWDPRFLARLAARYRVLVIDNAGIGRTSALPSPLTIDAMAQQTSAFIDALHLGAVPVLGWSMGGMIAQALAVLHPDQVRSLVLTASFAGDGKALPVPAAAAKALASGQPAAVLATLFPTTQAAAAQAYGLSVISYPGYYEAPAPVALEQGAAIAKWSAGQDPAGLRVAQLRVPTLVADGSEDAVVPLANTRALAGLIPGADLQLYPGAGHAFLFQDAARFVAELVAFTAHSG